MCVIFFFCAFCRAPPSPFCTHAHQLDTVIEHHVMVAARSHPQIFTEEVGVVVAVVVVLSSRSPHTAGRALDGNF